MLYKNIDPIVSPEPLLTRIFYTHRDFSDNSIRHIGQEDAKSLHQLRKVYLAGNPLHCDCNLDWLRLQLLQNKLHAVKDVKRIRCASPQHVQSQALTSLSRSQLCGSTSTNSHQRHSVHKRSGEEIKKCGSVVCHSNAICTEDKCLCKKGYTGDGKKCTDINECKAPYYYCNTTNKAFKRCKNLDGSYECECNEKFFKPTPDKKNCTGK